MEIPLTLRNLFSFQLFNDREKEVFKFDEKIVAEMKAKLDDNKFYLGGQIKMKYDDKIGLANIEMVNIINNKREIEYGPPCNGFEAQSIIYHKKTLKIVENMIIKYYEIIALRESEIINKLLPPSPP
jgi:hypothetical protein